MPTVESPAQPDPAPPAHTEPALELPAGLKTKPWRHQFAAFQFTMERLLRGAGIALLAFEMGVGKTLVALMVLAALAAKRTLICCPLRVVPVWELQIERHLDLPLIVVTLDDDAGSVANKKKLAEEKLRLSDGHVAISAAALPLGGMSRECGGSGSAAITPTTATVPACSATPTCDACSGSLSTSAAMRNWAM